MDDRGSRFPNTLDNLIRADTTAEPQDTKYQGQASPIRRITETGQCSREGTASSAVTASRRYRGVETSRLIYHNRC